MSATMVGTRKRKYVWFADPNHEWLRVPMADLAELGIAGAISAYSYRDSKYAYLEGDRDAQIFLDAANARCWDVEFDGEEFTAGDSPIRSLPSFLDGVERCRVTTVLVEQD